ncbi:SEC-C metal-binding domain-containing protein [Aliarcobacter butzleri]|uniref:SEC-C metal-binding domain-containing protein n=1 Tax=Aliarcobacter butzleri TaxID=28197 RepID=UPI0012FB6F5A|nr:SEC-C metal-binding domain-containing protein [Aliarcobacter butzleri]
MNLNIDKFKQEQDIFDELAQLCISSGYIHAIAFLCFSNNIVMFEDEPTADNLAKIYSNERLIRTEISTLVGLMLKKEVDYTIPKPIILQKYIEDTYRLLKELHQAIIAPSEDIFIDILKNNKDENPFTKGEILREAIFYSAESAYDFQYLDLFVKKYKNDNEWFVENKNFHIENIQTLIKYIVDIQQKKILKLGEKLLSIHPDFWTTMDVFSFTIDELIDITGFSMELISNILQEFTVNTSNEQFQAIGDYNVINAKPLIKKNDNTYILFQHYGLLEAAYESPFFWFKECDETYFKKIATKHRGDFTEDFSYEILSNIFGVKNVFKNIDIFDNKNKVGEIDVLVVFANRAIVLQAKSKKLRLESRKGNDNLLVEDFKKAIQDSYEQGLSCAKLIQEKKYKLLDASKNELIIRNDFKEIYIFCVVSDHYPALAFQTQQFLKFEENKKIKPPFVMDIFLLDVMSEMLSNPLYFLSYTNKRTTYFKKFIAQSEYSILSYHLKKNLYLSDEYSMMMIDDSVSSDLDLALIVRKKGLPGKDLPEGILTKYRGTIVGKFIDQIKKYEYDQSIEIGLFLLTLSEEAIGQINEGIQKTIDLFNSDGKSHDFTVGFDDASAGITIHTNNLPNKEAFAKLLDHCKYRKYRQQANNWFGLCFDPLTRTFRFGVMSNTEWTYSVDMGAKVVKRALESKINIGRNDKCPCGSGKKYKKCCIGKMI